MTRAGRLARISAAIAAAVSLAACSGDQLLTTNTLTADISAAPGGAYGAGGEPKAPPFNPFHDGTPTDYGRREVMANPALADVLKTGPLPEMSIGSADAPVTVVKYASLTCPYCRRFQATVFPAFKRDYIDTGKVRYIVREFPIGRSSGNATIALRCAPASQYFTLYGKFLDRQASWVSQEVRIDKIHAVAAESGLSRAEFDACLKNQDLIAGLKWVKDRGRTLGVIGTPNFYIQNKLVKKVLDYGDLKALVDAELAAGTSMAVAN
ncbi:MAG: disulfide bond formation protein DsbD [Alphaproteobacteria bacterium BRH_c36]|nr:MAG: disulfide bond formation protein DsbD [Alphaproteobacteria bacterium BRH_c36]